MYVKPVEAFRSLMGMMWKFGERELTQVSSSSLDHVPKLQGLMPIAMSGRCTPTDPKLGLRPDHFAKVATTNGEENIYNPVNHKVSHGGLHRSKREAHITKKRRITRQTSMSYPGFEPRPYGTAVSVTNH
ncbi:hypothetical protein TNCV_87611 [Trichonephila clavipes]|nr:hypothetical protein TNCV_87611 [Trichonephila clavipes]